MTDFKRIVPVLKVSDMQKSVSFYTGVLGFTVAWRAADDGGGENCMVRAGAAELLLSTGSHLGDKPQFTGTLYFQMSGVQGFFEKVKNRAEVVWPWTTTRGNSASGTATATPWPLRNPWKANDRRPNHQGGRQ